MLKSDVQTKNEIFATNTSYSDDADITVEGNLGLVRLCASRFRNKGIEYEELYSAGCMGLVKAVKSFDRSRGVRFSTYAVPVILGEIRRLFRDGGAVKVSRLVKERWMMISRLTEKAERDDGVPLSIEQLCSMTGLSRCEVIEALDCAHPTVSLTSCQDDSDDGQTDLPTEAHDEKITDAIALRQVLDTLDERDRQLIDCRFFQNMTQQATADRLRMTQVQVSRREKKLLLYLRSKLCSS